MDNHEYEPFEEAQIDPHELDEESLLLPSVYHKFSDLLVEQEQEKEIAIAQLNAKKAELDDEIRRNPNKYNLAKLTETAIVNKINVLILETDEWHAYLDAKKTYNKTKNNIEALNKKDNALDRLTKLYLGSYFIGPKEPKILSAGKRKVIEEAIEERSTKKRGTKKRRK